MDFMTSAPYWGILLIVLVNWLVVYHMKVTIDAESPDLENEDEF